jgi:hypothetical protein
MCATLRCVSAFVLLGLGSACSADTAVTPDCREDLLLQARHALSEDWREELLAFAESPPAEFESIKHRGKYILAIEPNTASVKAFLVELEGEIVYEFKSWNALVGLLPLEAFPEIAASELVSAAWIGAVVELAGAGCALT